MMTLSNQIELGSLIHIDAERDKRCEGAARILTRPANVHRLNDVKIDRYVITSDAQALEQSNVKNSRQGSENDRKRQGYLKGN